MSEPERSRLFIQERAVLCATEAAAKLMEERGVSYAALAARTDRSPEAIRRFFGGESRITIRDLSDILYALDAELVISVKALKAKGVEGE